MVRRLLVRIADEGHKVTRDMVLFAVGLLGVAHETLWAREPREMLLLVFCGFIGSPFMLRADEALHRRREGGDKPNDP